MTYRQPGIYEVETPEGCERVAVLVNERGRIAGIVHYDPSKQETQAEAMRELWHRHEGTRDTVSGWQSWERSHKRPANGWRWDNDMRKRARSMRNATR